jgi:hypothetical protein
MHTYIHACVHTHIHIYIFITFHGSTSQMATGCEISHNGTVHIHKYNLNTQSKVILQINPHTVVKL